MTSPPYWGLRDYKLEPLVWDGTEGCEHQWDSIHIPESPKKWDTATGAAYPVQMKQPEQSRSSETCTVCRAWRGSLGLEPSPDLYVQHLVQIMREVRRVLRAEGTVWLNLGDSYAGSWGNRSHRPDTKHLNRFYVSPAHKDPPTARPNNYGLKEKDLVGIPWRVAFALQADGWWLRSDVIWHKVNPMPESVRDRPTRSHEYLFLLTKSARYFYDADAIREPQSGNTHARRKDGIREHTQGKSNPMVRRTHAGWKDTYLQVPGGRNKRSVWTIPCEPFRGAHFATFPTKLVEPCILAGTSERGVCPRCGAPWVRVVQSSGSGPQRIHRKNTQIRLTRIAGQAWLKWKALHPNALLGWAPSCRCGLTDTTPAVVLDPFMGSGTVGVVALRLCRIFIGVDLNPDYVGMAGERIGRENHEVEILSS